MQPYLAVDSSAPLATLQATLAGYADDLETLDGAAPEASDPAFGDYSYARLLLCASISEYTLAVATAEATAAAAAAQALIDGRELQHTLAGQDVAVFVRRVAAVVAFLNTEFPDIAAHQARIAVVNEELVPLGFDPVVDGLALAVAAPAGTVPAEFGAVLSALVAS